MAQSLRQTVRQSARQVLSAWLKMAIIPLAGLLVACGGSSDGGVDTTTVTGSVVAAPVGGASVVAKDVSGNQIAGPVTTAADGSYSLEIPDSALSSTIIVESTGGSFDDEASGSIGSSAGMLAAHVAAGSLSAGSAVHITPASTIVRELVAHHGKTLTEAESAFESAFGFAVDTDVAPTDATAPAAGAAQAQLLAGLRAAAFSQMAMDLGLTSEQQFDLLPALAQDLSDGELDGDDVSGAVTISGSTMLPADIRNRFALAMVNFREGGNDHTGLGNDLIGTLPFAKVALSSSYRVEYVPGMMAAMEGKTRFTLRITDRNTVQAITGQTVSLMPMMHMAAHEHATPVEGCTETATPGDYTCTLYYLMGSSMMNGMSMGYWQLKVMVGGMMGESVTFYPQVMMAMGDTGKAVLKGQADMIAGMAMAGGMAMDEHRSYYLFNAGLTGMTGNYDLDLFVAAKESMMSYPAVFVGTTLNAATAYELTVASMSVEVSTDESNWTAATDNGNGHWTVSGISGLTNGMAATLYVRLTVNGEQKTADGAALAGDGTNDYARFTVTPGGM
jgi:hypothetical protein